MCFTQDNMSKSLTELQQQKDIQGAVEDVCKATYENQLRNAKNVLVRLFNFGDPLSWQCFTNEQQVVANVTKNDLNTHYCQIQYPGSTATLSDLASFPTAYDWRCEIDSIPFRVSMDKVCQDITQNLSAIGLLDPQDFTKINNWQCWKPG